MAPSSPADSPADDDTEAYVGLSVAEAEERAHGRGWTTVRALPPDAIITMEYLAGRLNLAVRDGVVLRCWQG